MARRIEKNAAEKSIRVIEYTGEWSGEHSVIREETYFLLDLDAEQQLNCMLHGLNQKLGDSTASMGESKGFSTDERFDTINELWLQLTGDEEKGVKGSWNKPTSGGSAKISPSKLQAKAKELGISEEQVALLMKALGH